MCGLGGELRFDGAPPDVEAVARMSGCLRVRGPDGSGTWQRGPAGAAATTGSRSSTCPRPARSPWPTTSSGSSSSSTAASTTTASCARSSRRVGYRFRSHSDTEVILKAYHRWGAGASTASTGCSRSRVLRAPTGRLVLARDRLGIKPLYVAETPGRVRFASTLPALLAAGDVDTTLDPVALHHYMSWHSVVPAPRTILAASASCRRPRSGPIERDGTQHRLRTGTRPRPGRSAGAVRPRSGRRRSSTRCDRAVAAADGRPTSRSACCCPAAWTRAWSWPCSAEAGQQDLAHVQHRLRGRRRASPATSSSTPTSIAKEFGTDHHKITDRARPARARRSTPRSAR